MHQVNVFIALLVLLLISWTLVQAARPIELAERRNRLVAALAGRIIVAHASIGSRTERLCSTLIEHGKPVYTIGLTLNAHLMDQGIVGDSISGLSQMIL
jgi:predicted Rossmann fold nucleotide-binding protein DprA/Smf involved in DNA uptake